MAFGIEARLTMALFAILTPYPGTGLYRRLKAEGRLTDERWWLRRDHDAGSPYFVPARMTRDELREGWTRAWREFYSPRAIWDRFTIGAASGWIQNFGYFPLNLMQHRLARRKEVAGGLQRFLSGVGVDDAQEDRPLVDETLGPADLGEPARLPTV